MNKMQQPLTVEESMKHFVTPVGFKVKLFVAEPQLEGKPIYMTWMSGPAVVCETYDYPNELQRSAKPRQNSHLRRHRRRRPADKFTVFAEKLSIPTTLAFYRGGAIVQNGTETLYLKDTDGDDRADLKRFSSRLEHARYAWRGEQLSLWPRQLYWAMQGYKRFAARADQRQTRPAIPPRLFPL